MCSSVDAQTRHKKVTDESIWCHQRWRKQNSQEQKSYAWHCNMEMIKASPMVKLQILFSGHLYISLEQKKSSMMTLEIATGAKRKGWQRLFVFHKNKFYQADILFCGKRMFPKSFGSLIANATRRVPRDISPRWSRIWVISGRVGIHW